MATTIDAAAMTIDATAITADAMVTTNDAKAMTLDATARTIDAMATATTTDTTATTIAQLQRILHNCNDHHCNCVSNTRHCNNNCLTSNTQQYDNCHYNNRRNCEKTAATATVTAKRQKQHSGDGTVSQNMMNHQPASA